MPNLWTGVWLIALMGAILSMIDSLSYFPAILPGAAIVLVAGFLCWRWQKVSGIIALAICLIWLVLRLAAIGDGLGFFANRLFTLSEEGQDFCYTHFDVTGESPLEGLIFVTCLLGALGILVGNGVNLVLTLLLAIMIAYFGVSPDIVWLSILVFAAFANALPKKGRWLPAILIAIFVAATAISAQTVAPEPNEHIAEFADKFLDIFVETPPPEVEEPPPIEPTEMTEYTEMTEFPDIPDDAEIPEDFEIPEDIVLPPELENNGEATETVPMPPEPENPNPGDGQGNGPGQGGDIAEKALPIALAILLVAAIVGLWLLYISQKRKRNRAAMYAQDNAEAIRGMYFYAKRWRALHANAGDIPSEVESVWLEAAFSEHKMTDAQREYMRSFVRYSAANAWNTFSWWKRLVVCFFTAL